jgi:hypothetical protein
MPFLSGSRREEEMDIEDLLKRTPSSIFDDSYSSSRTIAVCPVFLMSGSIKLPGTYPPRNCHARRRDTFELAELCHASNEKKS